MKWIKNVSSLSELRTLYIALARQYHTDTGHGNKRIMQEINNERDEWLRILKQPRPSQSVVVSRPSNTRRVPEDDLDDMLWYGTNAAQDKLNEDVDRQIRQGNTVFYAITLVLVAIAVYAILQIH